MWTAIWSYWSWKKSKSIRWNRFILYMKCSLISPECFTISRYFYTFKNISKAFWQQKVESCGVVTTRSKWWEEAKTKCVLKIINSLPLGPKSLNPTTWLVQAVKVFVECLWLIEWLAESGIINRGLYWAPLSSLLLVQDKLMPRGVQWFLTVRKSTAGVVGGMRWCWQ